MVFNGDTYNDDICSTADDYINTTDLTFPLEKKARYANRIVKIIWSWIFSAYGGWEYDDSNNTDFPIATTSLNAGQIDYDTPGMTIRGVEVLPQSGIVFLPLKKITEEEIQAMGRSEGSFLSSTTGVPQFYRPIGNSFKLYPPANYTANGSLRVTFDRGSSTQFLPTDTTKMPGFESQFHWGVGLGMAWEFAKASRLSEKEDLQETFEGNPGDYGETKSFRSKIISFYKMRYAQNYPSKMRMKDTTSEFE